MQEKQPEKKTSPLSEILESISERLLSFAASFIESKVRFYATATAVSIASVTIILYGIGSLLGSLFPAMPPGTTHILVGLLAILMLLAYVKRR